MIAIAWVMIAMAFNTTLSFMRDFAHSKESEPVWFVAEKPTEAAPTSAARAGSVAPSSESSAATNGQQDESAASDPITAYHDPTMQLSEPDLSIDESDKPLASAETLDPAKDSSAMVAKERQMIGRQVMIQQLLRNWVDSLYFDVPVIGARFSATDAGIIGGILLCILGVWSVYSARRENHLIFYLIRDTERYETDEKFRKYLKNQLHATQLFAKSRQPQALSVDQLRPQGDGLTFRGPCELTVYPESDVSGISGFQPPQTGKLIQFTASEGITSGAEANSVSEWNSANPSSDVTVTPDGEFRIAGQMHDARSHPAPSRVTAPTKRTSFRLRGRVDWRVVEVATLRSHGVFANLGERVATLLIFFLPTVALLLVLSGDIGSLFMDSPVRAETGEKGYLFFAICPDYWCPGLYARLVMSAALLVLNGAIMRAAYRYQKATNSLLNYIDQVCWSRKLPAHE
jgi:hypothetical protein